MNLIRRMGAIYRTFMVNRLFSKLFACLKVSDEHEKIEWLDAAQYFLLCVVVLIFFIKALKIFMLI